MKLIGKVKVQLFDAKTGIETDRREGHNIITNAAHYLMNGSPYGLDRRTWGNNSNTMQTDWSTIFDTIFGGILIFSTSITESASHIFEPLSNYPVGYGSMLGQDTFDPKSLTLDGTNTQMVLDNDGVPIGYQYAYDAGTSQANGIWNTVCLTSGKGGYGYIEGRTDGNIFDSYFHRNVNSNTLYIGSTSEYMYFISEAYGTSTLSRMRIKPYDIPLYGNAIFGQFTEGGSTVNAMSSVMTVNDTDRIFIDGENDCIYKLEISGQSLTVTKYNDEEDLTDTTVYSLSPTHTVPTYNRGRFDFCVRDGYMYMGNRGTKVLKVKLADSSSSEITVTEHTHSYSVIGMSILPTGDIYRYPEIIDENDVPHTIGSADATVPAIDFCNGFNNWAVRNAGNYGYGGSIITPYLATIKNLPSPVTKDTSKTAKITYTLTASS